MHPGRVSDPGIRKRSGGLVAGLLLAAALLPVLPISVPHVQAQTPVAAPHERGDIAGTWQGTLQTPNRSLRTVVQIAKSDKGWSAKMYSIDQGSFPINISSITLEGSTLKYSVSLVDGSYTGTLSPDGNTVTGTWTQAETPLPLVLVRATKETAWEIPPPPAPPKQMPADADPSFEVATIKPNDSGAVTMQSLRVNGRNFTTKASSLLDLIAFAYDVQMKQVVGAPEWSSTDRYDIAAVFDQDGLPNPQQLRSMIRKLLTERFALKFHQEKRDLSAYVLTVAKTGEKLAPTQIKGPLPGLGFRPTARGLILNVRNGQISDFTGFLQTIVLDRPVVDQTGLTGRYDFQFTFTPDPSEFNGRPPKLPQKPDTDTDAVDPAPDLFDAMQQQVGLRLSPEKTAVDVIAVDHVEKPSAN